MTAVVGGDDFLASIFAGVEGSVIIAKPITGRGYFQRSWCFGDAATLAPGAWYWCCSTSKAAANVDRDGVTTIKRRKPDLARTCALVLDDIGTKVETVRVEQLLPPPSAIVETSPGNFQWVYILDGGADPQEAATALDRLAVAEITDAGAKDASHVFRLPGSINDKAAVLERNGGQPWPARVTLWEPERRYTLAEIVERVPRSAEPKARRKADAKTDRQLNGDHGLDILQRFNMVLGQGSDGGINIKCPWRGEHSSETSDSATTYWPPKSGKKPGFKCMHGHCDGRSIKDLHVWLRAMDPAFSPRPPNGTGKAAAGDAAKERGAKQADVLLALAAEAKLFHTADDGTGFADLEINGHRETWPIQQKGFRRWLAKRFFETTGGAPNSEAMQAALGVIEAKAQFNGPAREVHIRVGGLDGKLYLDLCDDGWRAVEIGTAGWQAIDQPPVRFRRAAGMLPLPIPQRGGSIAKLRDFLNVASDNDFTLVVAWVLACLRNRGPYPVLVLMGEQGSAKSTFAAILRKLIDACKALLRSLPRDKHELAISAGNIHLLVFDNVSSLTQELSDALCRLATGGGLAARRLYTDQDEVLFDACRPIILNGIENFVSRPDLADRAIFLTLTPIPEEKRRTEAELWSAFEAERPHILGALLDAMVEGLKRLPETHLPKLRRMADFTVWGAACEAAMWPAGTFLKAYDENIDGSVEAIIDGDPVATAVRTMMTTQTKWEGIAKDLLSALAAVAGERAAMNKAWPATPEALRGRLRRAATGLRKIGITIVFPDKNARPRNICIACSIPDRSRLEDEVAQPSELSEPSAATPKSNACKDLTEPERATVFRQSDSCKKEGEPTVGPTVGSNPLKSNSPDSPDSSDSENPIPSTSDKPRVERRL